MSKINPNGAVIYEGPSKIDGAPIVVIATGLKGSSANRKTGDMVQTWIMRADMEPHNATDSGADASVCGGCPHRPARGGSCYVKVWQAPLGVYRAYKRGSYAHRDPADCGAGRRVRLGSYGDPAAVPDSVWQAFTSTSIGWTGYTHQWRSKRLAGGLKGLCQASVDTPAEHDAARAKGWGTFRVRLPQADALAGEIICPASKEGGERTDCANCNLCSGVAGKPVVIIVHGSTAKRFEG